jgi:capsular exopolysaccharide synthesis family protein
MENRQTPFDLNEFSSLEIKALMIKILSYWKWFLLSLFLAFFATKYYNEYQERIYSLKSLITVKDENNPIFSSSTNIAFNWGGPSDKVETIKTILKSRTHNEKVVQNMQYYVEYLQEGKYRFEDVYGKVPYKITIDTTYYQLINTLIKLEFTSKTSVNISIDFKDKLDRTLLNFHDFDKLNYTAPNKLFSQEFSIGKIETEFLKIDLNLINNPQLNKAYYLKLKDFNTTVGHYRKLNVITAKKGTSLIELTLKGTNKKRIVNFLNTTVKVLEKDQIAAKIKYAVKTKSYIDTLFRKMANSLRSIESDLGDFKQKQNIYNLSEEGTAIFQDVLALDDQTQNLNDRLEYFISLKKYINSHDRFESNTIPVPAVLKMEDTKISKSIGVLVSKYKIREILLQTVTPEFPTLKQLDAEIDLERNALLENLSMLQLETNKNLNRVKNRLNNNQYRLKKLPQREQKLLSFERKYAITEKNYNYLKQKSYEAGTAIASNVSDVKVIDTAKDIGQGFIKPNKRFNTLAGLLLALVLPLLFILLNEFFNNKINTVEEVENNYKIPVLGVIGTKTEKTNLVVFENPKSAISESYRALRSNVQFMLKRGAQSHIMLLTSSISGEGKTLTAMNLASVFALSGKKTILVGVDLRKPKIADDFNMNNKIGFVHYLINQKKAEEVIQHTGYENLDILLSGPVPPNPSELLLSEETKNMMDHLREHYEYIILDAPPIGAVSDAQELFTYADTVLYLIRQGHTDKGLLKMIETKYERKEVSNISYILNDFTFSKRHGYGYGDGGYGYGYGYYQKEKLPFFKRIFSKFKG